MSSSLVQLALKTRVDLSASPLYRNSAEISTEKIYLQLDREQPTPTNRLLNFNYNKLNRLSNLNTTETVIGYFEVCLALQIDRTWGRKWHYERGIYGN